MHELTKLDEVASDHNYSTSSGNSSCNTSDLNGISVDYNRDTLTSTEGGSNIDGLKYLPKWPPVDIEFHDLCYTVPDLNNGSYKYYLYLFNAL